MRILGGGAFEASRVILRVSKNPKFHPNHPIPSQRQRHPPRFNSVLPGVNQYTRVYINAQFGVWLCLRPSRRQARGAQRRNRRDAEAQATSGRQMMQDVLRRGRLRPAELTRREKAQVTPLFLSAALSCRKPRKGASPAPGPTITIGTVGSAGRRKCDLRTWIGANAPAS